MVSIYTDGSSGAKGNKPGGWAYVIVRDGQEVLAVAYGGSSSTTNNAMELTAAINGMRMLLKLRAEGLVNVQELAELVSDSQYTLGMASGGWTPTTNFDLVKEIVELRGLTNVRLRWVRGHQGFGADGKLKEPFNERADSLANRGKREHTPPSVLAKQDKKKFKKAIAKAKRSA